MSVENDTLFSLTKCYACETGLSGSETVCRCPTCGTEYERGTFIILGWHYDPRPRTLFRVIKQFSIVAALAALIVATALLTNAYWIMVVLIIPVIGIAFVISQLRLPNHCSFEDALLCSDQSIRFGSWQAIDDWEGFVWNWTTEETFTLANLYDDMWLITIEVADGSKVPTSDGSAQQTVLWEHCVRASTQDAERIVVELQKRSAMGHVGNQPTILDE